MNIGLSTTASAIPGSFDARISWKVLFLPPKVYFALRRFGIFSAEQLVSFLRADPEVLTNELAWDPVELQAAFAELIVVLGGHVDDAILRPKQKKKRPSTRRASR